MELKNNYKQPFLYTVYCSDGDIWKGINSEPFDETFEVEGSDYADIAGSGAIVRKLLKLKISKIPKISNIDLSFNVSCTKHHAVFFFIITVSI